MFSDFVSFLCFKIEIIDHNEHNPEPYHSHDLIVCTRHHAGLITAPVPFLMHTLLYMCVLCSCFWSAHLPLFPKTPMFFCASRMPSIHWTHLTVVLVKMRACVLCDATDSGRWLRDCLCVLILPAAHLVQL